MKECASALPILHPLRPLEFLLLVAGDGHLVARRAPKIIGTRIETLELVARFTFCALALTKLLLEEKFLPRSCRGVTIRITEGVLQVLHPFDLLRIHIALGLDELRIKFLQVA